MPFTLVGWQQSVDPDDTLTKVNACEDTSVTISGTKIQVPPLNNLVAEYVAQASGMYAAQLQSPSLRRLALLDIAILQQGGTPSGAESFYPHFDCPIPLDVNEGLEALVNKPADSAVVATILAWLADGALTPVKGAIFTVRFTATITSVLTKWVSGTMTLSQTLPVGRYQIVGANVLESGGDLIAFRFAGAEFSNRPGGLATNNYGACPHHLQRYGGMGVWCEFHSLNLPSLEILNFAAASQSLVGYLDLIKVG